jgi:hypothetical protein
MGHPGRIGVDGLAPQYLIANGDDMGGCDHEITRFVGMR